MRSGRYWPRFGGLSLALLMAVAPACAQDEATPDQRFRQGKQLIEANCGDCMGSTAVGLEVGIAEVLKALEQGYSDRLTAYKLLAGAYGTLGHVFDPPDSDTRRASLDTQRKLAETLVELAPSDVEALQIYAGSLADPKQRLEQYQKILALKPDDPDARFGVGSILLAQGHTAEAVAEFRRAFEAASGGRAETYGQRLMEVLTDLGRRQEAGEIGEAAGGEAESGGGAKAAPAHRSIRRRTFKLCGGRLVFEHAVHGRAPAGLRGPTVGGRGPSVGLFLSVGRLDGTPRPASWRTSGGTRRRNGLVHVEANDRPAFLQGPQDVPSRDLFSFRGELSDSSMSGVLKRSGTAGPGNPAKRRNGGA